MKIMCFNDSAEAPGLIDATIETPLQTSGEVLIRVQAAGVTPTELSWYPTTPESSGKRRAAGRLSWRPRRNFFCPPIILVVVVIVLESSECGQLR
jgi:hypothetical protein